MMYILAIVTLPTSVNAQLLVRHLLALKLVAGVNILQSVSTFYIDGDNICDSTETVYLFRTMRFCLSELREALQQYTGEEDFELSVVPVEAINQRFADWVHSAVRSKE